MFVCVCLRGRDRKRVIEWHRERGKVKECKREREREIKNVWERERGGDVKREKDKKRRREARGGER